ncbi:YesL family protein [Ferdinandcohnia sp. Marseille-Q9671]
MNKTVNWAYSATQWIAKFAYLNLIWMGFTIIGLIVLGFFPATISMFAVIRKWVRGETDIPLFSTFWNTYKSEFIRSNVLGLFFWMIGGLMLLDVVFIKASGGSFTSAIQIPIYMFIFAVGLTTLYVFPVFVHYELTLSQIIKNSFLLMLISPLENIIMLVSIGMVFFVVKFIPGLGFFFGGSIIAAIIMAACYRVFMKTDKKKEQIS